MRVETRLVGQPAPDRERGSVDERETIADHRKPIAEPRVVTDRPVPPRPRERLTEKPATIVVPAVVPPPVVGGGPALPATRAFDAPREPARAEPRVPAAPALSVPRETMSRPAQLQPPEVTRPSPLIPAPAPPETPRLVIGRMRVDVIAAPPPSTQPPAAPTGERRTARGGVSARGSSLHVGLGQM